MQKRLAKEARDQEIQAKSASLGKKVKEHPTLKGLKGRGAASFYRVVCKVELLHRIQSLSYFPYEQVKIETIKLFFQDNGKGMPHDDIPNMLGRGL